MPLCSDDVGRGACEYVVARLPPSCGRPAKSRVERSVHTRELSFSQASSLRSAGFLGSLHMPLVMLNSLCPGVRSFACTWSVDVQQLQCNTACHAPICSVCAAVHRLPFSKRGLAHQLAQLYSLDIDLFQQARRQLPPQIATEATKNALDNIAKGLPPLRSTRKRLQTEALTRATYVVCRSRFPALSEEVRMDDATILAMDVALWKRLPPSIRITLCTYLAPNLSAEYGRICRIKAKGNDVFYKPIFWPILDAQSVEETDADDNDLPNSMMLWEIHSSVVAGQKKHVEELHRRMKRATKFASYNGFSARAKWARRCTALLGRMARNNGERTRHPLTLLEREFHR